MSQNPAISNPRSRNAGYQYCMNAVYLGGDAFSSDPLATIRLHNSRLGWWLLPCDKSNVVM